MCQTCYDRGYHDFPNYVGSAEHPRDYDEGYGKKASELGIDPEELRETDHCEKCFQRGKYDNANDIWSPPTNSARGHYDSYSEGYNYGKTNEEINQAEAQTSSRSHKANAGYKKHLDEYRNADAEEKYKSK